MSEELDVTFPNVDVVVEGMLARIYDDGSVEFYCEGDVRVPYRTLRTLISMADRFMEARRRKECGM